MSAKTAIESVIQTYADCMNESDSDKVKQAFHPSAKITGYLPDGLHEMSTEDFGSFVAHRVHQKKLAILSLWRLFH